MSGLPCVTIAFVHWRILLANPPVKKASGYLFLLAGVLFLAAAFMGKQVAFYGVGAMFVLLGVAYLIKSKDAG